MGVNLSHVKSVVFHGSGAVSISFDSPMKLLCGTCSRNNLDQPISWVDRKYFFVPARCYRLLDEVMEEIC